MQIEPTAADLQGVLRAADELIGLVDLDDVCRRAVELARERLGLERVGLFLLDGQPPVWRGTYGTDLAGQTTDERATTVVPGHGVWHHFLQEAVAGGPRWLKQPDFPLRAHGEVVGSGEHAVTAVMAGPELLAVVFNDNALSRQPLRDDVQEVLAAYGSLLGHIIQRKRVTWQLRASEELYRDLVESAQELIWRIDHAGRFTFLNQAWETVLGRPLDTLLGRRFGDFQDDAQVAADLPMATRFKAGQRIVGYRTEFRTAAGEVVHLTINGTPQLEQTGRFVGGQGTAVDTTAWRQQEQALQVQQDNLRSLFNATQESVFLMDPAGLILEANPTFAARLGRSVGDCVGRLVWDLIPPEVAAARRAHVAQVLRTGRPLAFDDTRDGLWLRHVLYPVLDRQGRVARLASYATDLTARRQSEEALRRSEERYHSFVEQSHEAIYCTEFDQPIDTSLPVEQQIDLIYERAYMGECNAAMAAMYGLPSPAEFAGRRLVDVHGGSSNPTNRAMFARFIASGYRAIQNETAEVLPDGQRRWFVSNDIGIVEDGHLVRIWGTSLDVTERRQAEEALRESRELLRAVLDAIPVRVFWKDRESRYLGCNLTFARDAGCASPDELLGRDDYELDWRSQADLYRADDQAVIHSGVGRMSYEEPQSRPNGEQLQLLTSKLPLRDTTGAVVGVLGTYLDITPRQRAEEALRASESRFRSIADYTFEWENWVGPDGELRWVSPAVEQLTGYAAAECHELPHFPLALVVAEDRAGVAAELQRALAGGEQAEYPFSLQRRDGVIRRMALAYRPITEGGQQQLGYRSCIRDITARSRAEDLVATRLQLAEAAGSATVDEVMQLAMDAAERLTDSSIGFFHVVDPDQEHLTLTAWSTNTVAHMCTAEGKGSHYPISMAGVWVDCFHTKATVIHNDLASLAHRKGMPNGHAPVIREMVVPVIRDGLVRAILGVGNKATDYTDDDARMLEALTGLVIDLVERKQAEQALRESEARHRSVVENSPDGVVRFDREGRHLYASPAMERLTGLPADALAGRTVGELGLPADFCETLETGLRRAQRTAESVECEATLKSGQGEQHINLRLIPERGQDGSVGSVLLLVRDITEHRRTERDYQRLFTSLDAAFAVQELLYDAAGRPQDWRYQALNPAFERLLGRSSGSLVGHCGSMVLPGLAAEWVAHFGEVVASGETTQFECHSADLGRHLAVTAYALGGQQVATLIEDVTQRLLLEEQVRHSQRLESIGRLAGGVAHDFNNLLTPILGYAQFLAADLRPDDPRAADVAEIQQAGLRARDLTRQLLAFGRKQVLSLTEVDLREVVGSFQRLLRRTLREDIELVVDLDQQPCVVLADAGQLEKVLMNLAVNAQDAMPDGGRLTIRVRAAGGAVRRAELLVSDTGSGIEAGILAHIFEPFYTTKRAGQGTGLGLATVHGIVGQHGGRVEVDSAPGQGTTFRVTLPLAVAPERAPRVVRPVSTASGCEGSETVAVVDDDAGILELARRALRAQGYDVVAAQGGPELLQQLRQQPRTLDLLVTDVVMPALNGRQLYEQLSAQQAGLRVLYITGYDDEVLGTRGVLDDGIQLLLKPFTPQVLCQKVRQVLDQPISAPHP
ncbi:MAG: PAS domain S-box protein [Fimbriimonadaceae bacterium]|nr:PAS domain S-box protein [Fimbriimonadaceae bacterium]